MLSTRAKCLYILHIPKKLKQNKRRFMIYTVLIILIMLV